MQWLIDFKLPEHIAHQLKSRKKKLLVDYFKNKLAEWIQDYADEKMNEQITFDDVICRICENKVPANVMLEHTDICQEKMQLKNEYHNFNLQIIEQSTGAYLQQQTYSTQQILQSKTKF